MQSRVDVVVADILSAVNENDMAKLKVVVELVSQNPIFRDQVFTHLITENGQTILDYICQLGRYEMAVLLLTKGARFGQVITQHAFAADVIRTQDVKFILRLMIILKIKNDLGVIVEELAKEEVSCTKPEIVKYLFSLSEPDWIALYQFNKDLVQYRHKIYDFEFKRLLEILNSADKLNYSIELESVLASLYKAAKLSRPSSILFWASAQAAPLFEKILESATADMQLVTHILIDIAITPIVWSQSHPLLGLLNRVSRNSWVKAQKIAEEKGEHYLLLALRKTVLELTENKQDADYQKLKAVDAIYFTQFSQYAITSLIASENAVELCSKLAEFHLPLPGNQNEGQENKLLWVLEAFIAVKHSHPDGSSLIICINHSLNALMSAYMDLAARAVRKKPVIEVGKKMMNKLLGSEWMGELHVCPISNWELKRDFIANTVAMLGRVDDVELIEHISHMLITFHKHSYADLVIEREQSNMEFNAYFSKMPALAKRGRLYAAAMLSLRALSENNSLTIDSGILESVIPSMLVLEDKTLRMHLLLWVATLVATRQDIEFSNVLLGRCLDAIISQEKMKKSDELVTSGMFAILRLLGRYPATEKQMQLILSVIKIKKMKSDRLRDMLGGFIIELGNKGHPSSHQLELFLNVFNYLLSTIRLSVERFRIIAVIAAEVSSHGISFKPNAEASNLVWKVLSEFIDKYPADILKSVYLMLDIGLVSVDQKNIKQIISTMAKFADKVRASEDFYDIKLMLTTLLVRHDLSSFAVKELEQFIRAFETRVKGQDEILLGEFKEKLVQEIALKAETKRQLEEVVTNVPNIVQEAVKAPVVSEIVFSAVDVDATIHSLMSDALAFIRQEEASSAGMIAHLAALKRARVDWSQSIEEIIWMLEGRLPSHNRPDSELCDLMSCVIFAANLYAKNEFDEQWVAVISDMCRYLLSLEEPFASCYLEASQLALTYSNPKADVPKLSIDRTNLFASHFMTYVVSVLMNNPAKNKAIIQFIGMHGLFLDKNEQNIIQEIFWHLGNGEQHLSQYSSEEQLKIVRRALSCAEECLDNIVHPYAITRLIYSLGRLSARFKLSLDIKAEFLNILLIRFIKCDQIRRERYIPMLMDGMSQILRTHKNVLGDLWINELLSIFNGSSCTVNSIDVLYVLKGLIRLDKSGYTLPAKQTAVALNTIMEVLVQGDLSEIILKDLQLLARLCAVLKQKGFGGSLDEAHINQVIQEKLQAIQESEKECAGEPQVILVEDDLHEFPPGMETPAASPRPVGRVINVGLLFESQLLAEPSSKSKKMSPP